MNKIIEYDKIYIYSPCLHQDLYQKLIKCFSNYIPTNIIPIFLTEEGKDIVIDEIINRKDFRKSNTEIETYQSIDELKFPQENDDGGLFILDYLNEKEMKDPRVQALFKRSRHNNSSRFIISQVCYELPKKTIRANGKNYHIFKPNKFLDIGNI